MRKTSLQTLAIFRTLCFSFSLSMTAGGHLAARTIPFSYTGPIISALLLAAFSPLFLSDNALAHDPGEDLSNKGGPGDSPNTIFDGGCGPGTCSVEGVPNYWINTATRMLVVQDTDFSSAGTGPSILMTRTYNMPRFIDKILSGMFGSRWSFAYESSIDHAGQSESPKSVLLNKGSGQGIKYSIDLSATLPVAATPPAGTYDRLTWYGNYWLFYQKNTRLTYRYDKVSGSNSSRLTSIADPDGNAVTINYNSDGTIKDIKDAANRTTSFAYNANKLCTSMTAPDGRSAAYEYDAGGNLIKTTDMLGSVATYAYDSGRYMTSLTVGGRVTRFTTEDGRVDTVTDARGNLTRYAINFFGTTEVTDPEGGSMSYGVSGGEGYTTFIADSLGNRHHLFLRLRQNPPSHTCLLVEQK
ncbi:MAG: RHS repeat protein [Acidobacteria bacterium]|nr:RHS repeat protein [Acidobacteriota bacterium]